MSSTWLALLLAVVMVGMSQADRRGRGGGRGGNDNDDDNIPDCAPQNQRQLRRRQQMDLTEEERYNLECPWRAICADEWNTIRDWGNGTRCRDHRIMLNCMCPGGRECPIGSPDHRVFANDKHSQYMCEPKCDIEMCSTYVRPAVETVQNSPAFHYGNYDRLLCRCPGHNFPLRTQRGRLNRATTYQRLFFNLTARIVFTRYRCTTIDPTAEDPCNSDPEQMPF